MSNQNNNRTQAWSCGGGTQSAAIAALIVQGTLARPDIALMVDTEREKSGTWEYMRGVIVPALAAVGVEMVVIRKSDFTAWDLRGGKGDLLLPVYTRQSGSLSKMPTFCSNEWKRRVAQRYLRSVGVEQCDVWLGMTVDEWARIKPSSEDWYRHVYPLADLHMRRSDCYALVESMGWPKPPRSACWMCPNMSDHEWRDMRSNHPADFKKAVKMDAELRRSDPDVYLHKSGVPLGQVEFDAQADLFGGDGECESGHCFV